ncbi:MAG: hypothetical protein HY905_21660 [Deltaproteobacteria bacterium]|nr:hypothetical protein [Deltaproteobacteria bacterium]
MTTRSTATTATTCRVVCGALVGLGLVGCGGPVSWEPLPADSSCYDEFTLYDGERTAMFCGGDATAQVGSLPHELRRLVICDATLEDLGALAQLGSLEHLLLYDVELPEKLGAVSALRGLRKLDLTGTQTDDWSFLTALAQLDTLVLVGSNLPDLSPLAGLTELESLDVAGTTVHDLSPLRDLTKLRRLRLSNTAVTDLAPLALLGRLEEIRLNGTGVTDLAPLAGLRGLRSLDLASTPVTDLTPLEGIKALRAVGVYDTVITFEQRWALEQAVNGPEHDEEDYLVVNVARPDDWGAYCPINQWRE